MSVSQAAKKALQNPISDMTIPFSDFRHNISNYIKNCWQNAWNSVIHNKLHNINPRIGLGVPLHSLYRREDVVMTRLRLGHTHLTHTHILSISPSPVCPACGTDLTVQSHPSHLPCFGHPPEFSILTRPQNFY